MVSVETSGAVLFMGSYIPGHVLRGGVRRLVSVV